MWSLGWSAIKYKISVEQLISILRFISYLANVTFVKEVCFTAQEMWYLSNIVSRCFDIKSGIFFRYKWTTTVGWTQNSWLWSISPRYLLPIILLGYVVQIVLGECWKLPAWMKVVYIYYNALFLVAELGGRGAFPTIPTGLWDVWLLTWTIYSTCESGVKRKYLQTVGHVSQQMYSPSLCPESALPA